jgi:tetratricopeptide (TPR) repeat protein
MADNSSTLALAIQHFRVNQLAEAEQFCRQVLAADPRQVDALHLLGAVLAQQGRMDEAIVCFRAVLRAAPNAAAVHNNLGDALRAQGSLEEAEASFREAIRLKPDFVEAHYNLGVVLGQLGRLPEAQASYRSALSLRPNFVPAHFNLGNDLRASGDVAGALACYREVLRLAPDHTDAYINLGDVLHGLERFAEAANIFREAQRLRPDSPGIHYNLGNALRELGDSERTLSCYREAIRLKPDFAEVHSNLGRILSDLGRYAEAAASYREALRCRPDLAEAHNNLGICLLRQGNLVEGWREFDWSCGTGRTGARRHFPQPLWQGESIPDGTILLHEEEGYGDTIQFIRCAALVKQRVGTVLCEAPPPLRRLLPRCPGIDAITSSANPPPAFDVHASLMSLPRIFGTTLASVPAETPYLFADAELTEMWARRLPPRAGLRVGIVWQGNPQTWDRELQRRDKSRSIPLRYYAPLARVPGVQLFSLQKGFGIEQIEQAADRFSMIDLGSQFDDFSDTAAVMKNLDLVISSCTSPAHLAGALGVPIWVALGFTACWRWLLDRDDTPWYPTMRLFRQKSPGDWTGVFERIAEALQESSREDRCQSPRFP